MSRLSPEMLEISFATTADLGYNSAALAHLKSKVEKPSWFTTLLGPNGLGKTQMLCAFANACIAAGHPCVYITTAEFLDDLRVSFSSKSETDYSKLFDAALRCRVLILDEWDRFNPTPWAKDKLFQLIEYRYRNGSDVMTLFASNMELDAIEPYIASRMQDRRCAIFHLAGPDLRPLL